MSTKSNYMYGQEANFNMKTTDKRNVLGLYGS